MVELATPEVKEENHSKQIQQFSAEKERRGENKKKTEGAGLSEWRQLE